MVLLDFIASTIFDFVPKRMQFFNRSAHDEAVIVVSLMNTILIVTTLEVGTGKHQL